MTQRQKRWIATVIVLLAFLAGVGFLLFLFRAADPAAEVVPAEVGEARELPEAEEPTDDEREQVIEFGAEETELMFTGSSALGQQPGYFEQVSGRARITPQGQLRFISGEVQMESLVTNADALTRRLKTEPGAFETERFPEARFVSTSILPAEPGSGEATHSIEGNLTVRDVTRSIRFPAVVELTEQKLLLTSEFSLDRQRFGVDFEGGPAFPGIRDRVLINLRIEAPLPD